MEDYSLYRISPINGLPIKWGIGKRPFNDCCLSQPSCNTVNFSPDATPIVEERDTKTWDCILSEVVVGIDDPDINIAQDYIRAATVELCKRAKVLQREYKIKLQKNQLTYPVHSFEDERVIEILAIEGNDKCYYHYDYRLRKLYNFSLRQQTIQLPQATGAFNCLFHHSPILSILIACVPTENSCKFDSYLYDNFRSLIVEIARRNYVLAKHYKNTALLQTLVPEINTTRKLMVARKEAFQTPSSYGASILPATNNIHVFRNWKSQSR